MDKFSKVDSKYECSIKSPKRVYALKIEILSYNEAPIKEMTFQAIRDVVGSIDANYQQLTRRTCSLNLLHYDEHIEDFIKYGNKFNLYLGLVAGTDIYWFPQGIFVVRSAVRYRDYFAIEGVDKGGILDGSVGLNVVDSQFIIEVGVDIRNAILRTLGMNIERHTDGLTHSSLISRPIDPQIAFVDLEYASQTTQREISIDSNAPIGDLFKSLADGYGAEIWYDLQGRFNFTRNIAFSNPNSYNRLPIKWVFDNVQVSDVQYANDSDTKNAVTVYTNSDEFTNVSETVYNTNPSSPNRIDLVGIRRMQPVEIPYTELSPAEEKKMCKAHGEFLLAQEEFKQNSITISAITIPHLDAGDRFIYGDDSFVTQSLSLRLDGSDMEITGVQIR